MTLQRDYAVGVVGFPRSGSSMVMRMLHAGGLEPVVGTQPRSYELPSLDNIGRLPVEAFVGRSVKLLDFLTVYGPARLPPVPRWRFVWMSRNAEQQAISTVKFLNGMTDAQLGPRDVIAFKRSIRHDYGPALDRVLAAGRVLRLRFEDVLEDPIAAGRRLQAFAGIDAAAAAAVVHHRDPCCLPNLTFELGPDVRAFYAAASGDDR